jgi:dolichol-phosphate mannosyltransferase
MPHFKDKLFIIIPCYNEQYNIGKTIFGYYKIISKFENGKILIINDGSIDNTEEVIDENIKNIPQIELINKENSGHGSTCLFGYKLAIEKGANYIFQVDSDNQNKSEDFWSLWNQKGEANFVFGNRKPRKDGYFRKIVTNILTFLIKIIFGKLIKDPNVPFRLMKANILEKYLSIIPPHFFITNTLLSIILVTNKEKIKWVDVEFFKRQNGKNSISLFSILKISKTVFQELMWLKRNLKNTGN